MVMSQIAEVLINATNQSMDSWDQSPAGSLMEVQLIDWFVKKWVVQVSRCVHFWWYTV
jgi:L-2,4-diaminobutyrate decarboxylase